MFSKYILGPLTLKGIEEFGIKGSNFGKIWLGAFFTGLGWTKK